MRTITALVVGALALTAASADAKDWKKVKIATEGAYAPWSMTDSSNKLIGFEIDLAADLCKRAKVECEVNPQDWDGIIPALQQGKYDAIMSALSINDERKKVIDFSIPYAADPSVFTAMKGNAILSAGVDAKRVDMKTMDAAKKTAIEKIATAFKGKTVGAQVSTIQATFMEKMMPGVTLRTYDKIDNAGLDLIAGRIDVLLADKSVVVPMMRDAGKDMTFFGPELVGGHIGDGIGMGIRKKDGDLKKIFDKAIKEAYEAGAIGKLATQWFGFDLSVKP